MAAPDDGRQSKAREQVQVVGKKNPNVDGFTAGGKSGRGTPSPDGWKDRRGSDATAPLKKPVNDENGFGHTGRKPR